MSDYYQCETTSTTKDKTLAKESNLPMATMFIYIFIFIVIFVCVLYYNSVPENSNFLNKYGRLIVLLLLFILFGILIAAIVNLN